MPSSQHTVETDQTTLHDLSMTASHPGLVACQACSTSNHDRPTRQSPTVSPSSCARKPTGRLERACLNLSPSFFSLNMGTGIASILLYNLPYNTQWVKDIGIAIFILNIVLFAFISAGNLIRYIRWKGIMGVLAHHLSAGMYWGCLPMGAVTIINMIAYVCVPKWGYRWAQLALGLWWIDVIVAIFVNFGMLFMMFTRQKHTPESTTAALLLPIVASVVAASSGGVVANALAPFAPHLARSTVIVSYCVWGTGVPVAMFFITFWIYRCLTVGLPAPVMLPALFLPLGPCGQGSFGIILLGSVLRKLAYVYGVGLTIAPDATRASDSMLRIADAVHAGGLVTGLVLWGLGLVWYTLAMTITIDHIFHNNLYLNRQSFSISWTSYTFPIGVWATATNELGHQLDSPAFRVIGMVVSLQVVLQWAYVFVMSCWQAWNGRLFSAAELDEWEDRRPARRWEKTEPEAV